MVAAQSSYLYQARAIVSKSVKRFSGENCGKNKRLEPLVAARAKPTALIICLTNYYGRLSCYTVIFSKPEKSQYIIFCFRSSSSRSTLSVFTCAHYNMNGSWIIDKADASQVRALQHLHAASFWRGWNEEDFFTFLRDETMLCFIARPIGYPDDITGFVLMRHLHDEAEIITLAVAPKNRRKGIGYALLDATLRYLHHQRAQKLFLEVEEKNHAAITLYRRFGFEEIGRRPGYYQIETGRCDALTMQRIMSAYENAQDQT